MKSAEWVCTKCGTVNRKYLQGGTRPTDKCVTCRLPHTLTPGKRPIRWEATPSK